MSMASSASPASTRGEYQATALFRNEADAIRSSGCRNGQASSLDFLLSAAFSASTDLTASDLLGMALSSQEAAVDIVAEHRDRYCGGGWKPESLDQLADRERHGDGGSNPQHRMWVSGSKVYIGTAVDVRQFPSRSAASARNRCTSFMAASLAVVLLHSSLLVCGGVTVSR